MTYKQGRGGKRGGPGTRASATVARGRGAIPKQTGTSDTMSTVTTGRVEDNTLHRYICNGGINKQCGKEVTDDEESIMCDGCQQWFHPACQGMDDNDLGFFAKPGRVFLCHMCGGDVPDLFKAKGFLKDLGVKVNELERKMLEVQVRLEDMEEKTDFKHCKEFKDTVWDMIEESKADEQEIKFRKPNLIFIGVKEPTGIESGERYAEEEATVRNIVEKIGISKDYRIKTMFRLKKKRDDEQERPETPRMLKVVFEQEEIKWEILKHSGRLKSLDIPAFKDIWIKPDLTYKERKANAELIKKCWEKNRELQEKGVTGKKWIIRGGRLKEIELVRA